MANSRLTQLCTHFTEQTLETKCSAIEGKEMPGPWKKCHPVYGNSKIVGEYFFNGKLPYLFEKWRDEYGRIYMWHNFPLTTKVMETQIIVADVKEVNRLLKANPPKMKHYKSLRLLGEGVLSQDDPVEWARQRELLKSVFSTNGLKRIVPVMESGAHELVEFIREKAIKGEPFDFHDYVSDLAFLMIGHSALGEETTFLRERARDLRHAFEVVLNKGFLGEDLSVDEEYRAADQTLKGFAHEVFQRYQQKNLQGSEPQGKCPFHESHASEAKTNSEDAPSAIEIILGNYKNGVPHFSDQQKEDQLSTFMFAGHETTANTLSWIMLELARNQKIQDKLREDILSTINELKKQQKSNSFKLEYKDLFKFNYLTLVINEGLRLWPVVALGTIRTLEEDMIIGGYHAPKGATLRFPHFLLHRDPEIWDDPTTFNPERKWHSEAFLPFTRAPRDCLGRNLAMLEIRMFLIEILSRFSFKLADPSIPIDIFEGGTMKPENGAWLIASVLQ